MDQIDRRERDARRSGAAPGMSAPFLSCAHRQTTSILARPYGHSAPLRRGSASVGFAVPATSMLVNSCARLPGSAEGALGCGFRERKTSVEYQTPPCCGVADCVQL